MFRLSIVSNNSQVRAKASVLDLEITLSFALYRYVTLKPLTEEQYRALAAGREEELIAAVRVGVHSNCQVSEFGFVFLEIWKLFHF